VLGVEPDHEADLQECAGCPGRVDDPSRIGGVRAQWLLHEDRDTERECFQDVPIM
jgi:hypothetical protein